MRSAILRCAIGLCVCLGAYAQQATLEGITVNAQTQQPMAGVHVSLVSIGVGTNLPEPDDAYGAISDRAGHYSIGNIRPGNYTLTPKHAGFVYFSEKDAAATPTITLKPGENNLDFRIPMTPEAIVTGRVIDEFGEPVQAVTVRAVSTLGAVPYGVWSMRTETDDRGEYRISGIPGSYYVEASVHPLESSGPAEIRTDGSATSSYATAYYPGALAKERAKAVEFAAGKELTGIDIHVAHQKSLKISGVVTGIPAAGSAGAADARATVTIRVYYGGGEAVNDTVADANGHFEFAGLAPAEYHVDATYPPVVAGGDSLQSPVMKATIETDDAVVNLPVSAGTDMTGTLLVEGTPPGQHPGEKWTIRLAPSDPDGTPTKGGAGWDLHDQQNHTRNVSGHGRSTARQRVP